MNYMSLAAIGNFLLYLGLGAVILYAFSRVYILVTPYNEFAQIKEGKNAPAIALVGAMFGFTLPLITMSYVGVDLIDYVMWAVVAMVVQLGLFKFMYRMLPGEIDADNQSVAILFAGASVCVGAVNAFSLIPH